MNREQMIEKVATAIAWEPSVHYPDALQLRMHVDEDLAAEIAAEIIDAILPQVTTVEELEALPDSSLLVTDDGYVLQHFADQDPDVILRAFGTPLTVVWQP